MKDIISPQSPEVDSEYMNGHIRELTSQIRQLMQAEYLYSKELDRTYNVSTPQLSCLLVLSEHGSLPPSKIARLIMLKSSTITGIIDRLEHKNLVRRIRNSTDRRVIMIEMTDAGRALVETAPPPIQKKVLEGLKKLPKERIDQIIESLRLLNGMFEL